MEEGIMQVKCPVCRGAVNPAKITDYTNFKKVHQPELLKPEERDIPENEDDGDDEDDSGSETCSDVDSNATSETEGEEDETLDGFVVDDDLDEEELREGRKSSGKGKVKFEEDDDEDKKKRKKGKGKKKKKKIDRSRSLAELKKEGMRNKLAKQAYYDRLEHDYKPSAKIARTMEMLQEIIEEHPHEKVLIFSQFTTLLDLLEIPIRRDGLRYGRYDGSMNARDRAEAVDVFRNDPYQRVMLVSLKAGNAGLNLNFASRVIIMDPFWNPYIEDQAIDRAHRIGQRYDVIVRRVVVPGTVEDRILALQEKKRELINSALDENAARSLARLGQRELLYLFGLSNAPPGGAASSSRDSPFTITNGPGSSAANAVML
jgi:SNF2 family DNA or RNA helicase